MSLLEDVKIAIKELDSIILETSDKLKRYPKEVLYVRKTTSREKNGYEYYSRDPRSNSFKSLNRSESSEVLKTLEEKGYYRKLQKIASEQHENLNTVKKILEKTYDWKNVFYEISEERRHLISPFELKNSMWKTGKEIENWKIRSRGRRNGKTPNATLNGEYVRSKSELIIADRLEHAGIPYVYEPLVMIVQGRAGQMENWHPDFRVLNKRSGKEYLWEHFGMMDNPEYVSMCMMKIEAYAANGWILGDNLIVTMELAKQTLDTQYVDVIIERIFK